MKLILLVALLVSIAGSAQAAIEFKDGWDSAENSDAKTYTKEAAKDFLRNQSEALKKIIEGDDVTSTARVSQCGRLPSQEPGRPRPETCPSRGGIL